MTPGLTGVRCECCGRVEDDEVAHLLIEEAVLRVCDEQDLKVERDAQAWADAEARLAAARA